MSPNVEARGLYPHATTDQEQAEEERQEDEQFEEQCEEETEERDEKRRTQEETRGDARARQGDPEERASRRGEGRRKGELSCVHICRKRAYPSASNVRLMFAEKAARRREDPVGTSTFRRTVRCTRCCACVMASRSSSKTLTGTRCRGLRGDSLCCFACLGFSRNASILVENFLCCDGHTLENCWTGE